MNIRLNVPYPEKDVAKAQGAKWDGEAKTWYIDDASKIIGVKKWIGKFNIICENLYVLKMNCKCWNCGKDTEVVLFATDKCYSKANRFAKYTEDTNIQILTYVTMMPIELKNYVQGYSYYSAYSSIVQKNYFMNHCKKCGSSQGDNFLHEIPNKAFYKKLFYEDSEPISFAKVINKYAIPLYCNLPYYDEVCNDNRLLEHHFSTGIENRASMIVSQSRINKLFECSIAEPDITIQGL